MPHHTRAFARLHDHARRGQRDQAGLSILAYALGAALVVVPLGVLLFAFGNDTAIEAGAQVDDLIART